MDMIGIWACAQCRPSVTALVYDARFPAYLFYMALPALLVAAAAWAAQSLADRASPAPAPAPGEGDPWKER